MEAKNVRILRTFKKILQAEILWNIRNKEPVEPQLRYKKSPISCEFQVKNAPISMKIKNYVYLLQFSVNFQCLITYICKKKLKCSLRIPDVKKKIKKFQPQNNRI